MPLLKLWKADPKTVLEMNAEQVVGIAGNGTLKDSSEACKELRAYFSQVSSDVLEMYAKDCLHKCFAKDKAIKGYVLQDIINELGKRLEYEVANGVYQGTVKTIGFDGLWKAPEGNSIIVEAKTTDFFRIKLETIYRYMERLREEKKIRKESSILIVVGREDTGDLEAQIRGSKYAWDMRLISIDALIKLVKIKESTEEEPTNTRIRNLLTPFEYTKLDNIVETLFITKADIETSSESIEKTEDSSSSTPNDSGLKGTYDFTDISTIDEIRKNIIRHFGENNKRPLIAKSRTLYWDSQKNFRTACTVSKKYDTSTLYWYAYHENWKIFLQSGDKSFFILGCVDKKQYFAIPQNVVADILPFLNTTTHKQTGKLYWHIHITKGNEGDYFLSLPKNSTNLPVDEYLHKY